jgi:uncharacterized RDD family membrane protein YckC
MTTATTPQLTATDPRPAAALPRRLAALVYDALLLLALLMIATAAFLPLTGGEAVTWERSPVLEIVYRASLAAVIVVFYGVSWTRQGRTLGMASWRLRVERLDGSRLTWRDTVVRLAAAVVSWLPAGLGWLWCLFDREHRTWHDVLSGTRVIVVSKRTAAQQ